MTASASAAPARAVMGPVLALVAAATLAAPGAATPSPTPFPEARVRAWGSEMRPPRPLFVRDPASTRPFVGLGSPVWVGPRGMGAVLPGERGRHPVELELIGADPIRTVGRREADARVSSFTGRPGDWRTDLPTFRAVSHRRAWPGIDAVFTPAPEGVKYAFRITPGGDVGDIRLRYRGARALWVGAGGDLHVRTPAGTVVDRAPVAWQLDGGRRIGVPVAFSVGRGARFGLRVGAHDPTRPLVIDPELVFSGYLGGTKFDQGFGVAMDADGNTYVAGRTQGSGFPATGGFGGSHDAFVAKVSPAGELLYATFLGGADSDQAFAVSVDTAGSVYLTGETKSSHDTFPVMVGPDLTFNDDPELLDPGDAFVAKLGPSGTTLEYAGYIGGHAGDDGKDLTVDDQGRVHVVGQTRSHHTSFPAQVGPSLTYSGGQYLVGGDAFVARVAPDGTGLEYAGYMGGSGPDVGYTLALEPDGTVHIGGDTASSQDTFPETVGPDLTFNGGQWDAFVAGVSPDGAALEYAGYLGGAQDDNLRSMVLDGSGTLYLGGHTRSPPSSFPVVVGPSLSYGGGDDRSGDGFVAKLRPDLTLAFAGYVGGDAGDRVYGIDVDATGQVFLTGETASSEASFPVQGGPDLTYNGGPLDAFVAAVTTDGTDLAFAGYLGGGGADRAARLALHDDGDLVLTGQTYSSQATFPVLGGPDTTYNGHSEGFVARVCVDCGGGPPPPPPPSGDVTLTVTKDGAGTGTGLVRSNPSGIDCGTDCQSAQATYPSGTEVTLGAKPDEGSSFGGWGGDCSGTGKCTLTMDSDKNVTATFTSGDPPPEEGFTLTVSKTGEGQVRSTPSGISCGSVCSASYPAGTTVELFARPASGSSFTGWSGDCTGTGSCTVVMDADRSVTATFTAS